VNGIATAGAGQAAITGPMTFATVTELRREGRRVLRAATGETVFDLRGVTQADSAGLALLVDWLAFGRAHGRQLRFVNLPETLQALAVIADVRTLLAA